MMIYVYTLTFAINKNGEGWKILHWFPKISCHVMDLEM